MLEVWAPKSFLQAWVIQARKGTQASKALIDKVNEKGPHGSNGRGDVGKRSRTTPRISQIHV